MFHLKIETICPVPVGQSHERYSISYLYCTRGRGIYAYDCIAYLGSCFRLFLCELIKRVRCVGDEESPEPIPESDHPVLLLVVRGLGRHREHRERGGRRGGHGGGGCSARQQAPGESPEYRAILWLFTWLGYSLGYKGIESL